MIQVTGTSTSAESMNFEGTEYFAQLYEKSNSASMTCIPNQPSDLCVEHKIMWLLKNQMGLQYA